jgi:hypothetical protein
MGDNTGLAIGRVVHYIDAEGEEAPAVVVRVWSKAQDQGCVNLKVLPDTDTDTYRRTSVMQGWGRAMWHWPQDCQTP